MTPLTVIQQTENPLDAFLLKVTVVTATSQRL